MLMMALKFGFAAAWGVELARRTGYGRGWARPGRPTSKNQPSKTAGGAAAVFEQVMPFIRCVQNCTGAMHLQQCKVTHIAYD